MNRVLVTGATGFLGRHVLSPLIGRGVEVHALFHHGQPDPGTAAVQWHRVDLRDREAVDRLIKLVKPTGLIHLAWESTPGTYWTSPANLDWTAASLQLIRSFGEAGGTRAVFAGTSAEYQWGGNAPLDEASTPLLPNSLYGRCKNALREIVASWSEGSGVSCAWGRIFNIFGPHEKPERLIPRLVSTLQKGECLEFDDGLAERDFLYVGDAGDAFAALYCSSVQGAINIASGEPVSIRKLVSLLAAHNGRGDAVSFGRVSRSSGDSHPIVAMVDRLHTDLGWRHSVSLQQRLQQTSDWWRKSRGIVIP